MSMDPHKLLTMAEQITANMNYTDDKNVVAAKVAEHLRKFWDPRMQATLCDYARTPEAVLTEVLSAAVQLLQPPTTNNN